MIRRAALIMAIAVLSGPAFAAGKPRDDPAIAALNSPERLVTIGSHARVSGDFMLALSFYERALGIDAGYLPALRAATEVALAVRLPEALAFAERWVSKQPQDGLAHLAVGAALVQQNRPTEAQKAFALAEAAGGPPAAIAVQRGIAFDLLGQSRSAQIAYADALQRAPGDRSILEYLALSFAIGGDDAAAMQLLQPEAEKASGQPSFERTLVLIHALAGRQDLARRIATSNLPPQASAAVGDLLQRIAALPTAGDKAAAVHLGVLPDAGRPVPAPPQVAVVAPPAPAAAPPAPAEAAAPRVDTPLPRVAEARPIEARPPAVKPVAIRPPPKPEPMPAGLPRLSPKALKAEQIWVQIGSSRERILLVEEHAKLKKKARGLLNGYNAYVQNAGGTQRLLVGPFRTMPDAQKAVKRLKSGKLDALVNRIAAGAGITPL